MERETIKTTKSEASFVELAAHQGVRLVKDFDALVVHPSAEDESVDEFEAMLREWRREDVNPRLHR